MKKRASKSLSHGMPEERPSATVNYSVIREPSNASVSGVANFAPLSRRSRYFRGLRFAKIIWRSYHHIRRDDATAAPFPGVVVGLRKFFQTISEA